MFTSSISYILSQFYYFYSACLTCLHFIYFIFFMIIHPPFIDIKKIITIISIPQNKATNSVPVTSVLATSFPGWHYGTWPMNSTCTAVRTLINWSQIQDITNQQKAIIIITSRKMIVSRVHESHKFKV